MARNLPDVDYITNKCKEKNMKFIRLSKEPKKGTMINFTCEKHEDKGIQKITWSHFKTSVKMCKYCCGRNKTTEDFKKEINTILPTIEILGEYTGSENKVLCKCKIDGHEWKPIARSLKNGQGCPICGRKRQIEKRTKSHDDFVSDLNLANENIEVIGTYINNSTAIKCRCKLDDTIWKSIPRNLLNNSAGCPTCARKRVYKLQALSNDEFLNRLSVINPTIEPLELYYNYFKKLKCRCKVHDAIFYQTPHGMLDGKNGCNFCTQSKGEEIMNDVLSKLKFTVVNQYSFPDCKYKLNLKFDAYDIVNNIAYEFNGEQHYYPIDFAGKGKEWAEKQFEVNKKRDNIKIEYCKNNDIPLIIIPYWEKYNMEYFLCNKLKELNIKVS